jgi:hypothetical protein
MERVGYFVAGFASGWAVRTTVDSSRALAVKAISSLYGAVDRAGRAIGMEREHLEDLFAEARAKYEADRARAARAAPEHSRSTPASAVHSGGSAPKPPLKAEDRAA